MPTREHLTVNGSTLYEVTNNLNFILHRLNQRLDQLEGVLGNPTFQSDIDLQGNSVTDSGGLTLPSVTITGNATISGLTVTGDGTFSGDIEVNSIVIKDTNDTIIHQFGIPS